MYLENQFHAFYQPAAFMSPSVQQANLTENCSIAAWGESWLKEHGESSLKAWIIHISKYKNCITTPYFIQVVWTSINTHTHTHTTEIFHVYAFSPTTYKISAISLAWLGRTF